MKTDNKDSKLFCDKIKDKKKKNKTALNTLLTLDLFNDDKK